MCLLWAGLGPCCSMGLSATVSGGHSPAAASGLPYCAASLVEVLGLQKLWFVGSRAQLSSCGTYRTFWDQKPNLCLPLWQADSSLTKPPGSPWTTVCNDLACYRDCYTCLQIIPWSNQSPKWQIHLLVIKQEPKVSLQ